MRPVSGPNDRPPLKVDLRLFSTRAGLPGGDDKGGRGLLDARCLVARKPARVSQPTPARVPAEAVDPAHVRGQIGEGVIIKPSVTIKYPWFLTVGDHSWIGERAWLDCTSPLRIGKHVVISQGAYISCGAHDWEDPGMGSVQRPVVVEDGAWIAAFLRVAGGVTIAQEAVVAMGAAVFTDCEPRATYRGNPAQRVGRRRIRDYAGPKQAVTVERAADTQHN